MSIDKSDVRHIAHLARIKVPEDELEGLTGDLVKILTWVERLGEVDTADVPPMASVTKVTLPRRRDMVSDGGYRDRILANAPDPAKGFFRVPKVVE